MDNVDKIRLLSMTFDNVVNLTHDVVTYVEGDIRYVTTLDGDILSQNNKDESEVYGEFLVIKKGLTEVVVKNFMTYIDAEFSDIYKVQPLGAAFLILHSFYKDIRIIDRNVHIIATLPSLARLGVYKENEVGCYFYIKPDYNINTQYGYANKLSGKIESFGSFELNEELSCVAVNVEDNKQKYISINSENLDRFRYKLARYGNIVSENTYLDIITSPELNGTDLLYCIECSSTIRGRVLYGIINKHGKELLKPVFDSVTHTGNKKFILKSDNNYCLYDLLEQKVLIEYTNIVNITQHTTLPLSLIQLTDNSFMIIDYKGDLYSLVDFTKHFKCYYSNEHKGVIKVEINQFNTKYITDRFTPITNIKEISKLMCGAWISL